MEDIVFNDITGVSLGHFSTVMSAIKVLRSPVGIKADYLC